MEVKVNVFENRRMWYGGPVEQSWRVVLFINGRAERTWDINSRDQLWSVIEKLVDEYRFITIDWRVTESWA